MRRRLLMWLVIVWALSLASTAQGSQQTAPPYSGIIQGRVLDLEGQPIGGARVYGRPSGPISGAIPWTNTDKRGRFVLRDLAPGTYTVYAKKEQDDLSFGFFNVEPWAMKVTVYGRQVTKGVVVRLYSKTGQLLARSVDARTRQPVVGAGMLLCRDDNPKHCLGTGTNQSSGMFRLLIPSIALRVKVSAPGYEDWYYGRDGSKENAIALQLAPNETKKLVISLRPVK